MTRFSDLELDERVLKAVAETGYETPTPIQAQAIPHALQGRDVLGIAQTGTGKTASFTLPMLTMLAKGRARARMPRSLVLAPTRELAAQVAENFETYAKHLRISMALLIGGTSFKDQDKLIDRGVDVLIATPGRLLDHFERGKLMLTGVQIMVVDEADRMLDMGFIPDIERIFKLTPFTRQTMFYSATMAPEITRITQEFLSNPVRVEVARQATTSETIEQVVCKHQPSRRDRADKEKREVLRRLIDAEGEALTNGIIFCNRKRDVDVVAKSLKKHGYDAGPIHGDLDQSIRTRTLDGFRNNELRLLIASDVAARGLDIPSVSHVFNYDIPTHSEDYVHRIGRTGRAGREGKAISLCMPSDQKYLDQIEELVKKTIPVVESPLKADRAPETMPEEQEERPRARSRSRSRTPKEPAPAAASAPAQPSTGGSQSRSEQGDNRRGRGRGGPRDSGPKVIGMGSHVPAFLTRDLRQSLEDARADVTDEAPEEDDTADVAETPVTEDAPEAPKPRKSRARSKTAAPDTTEVPEPAETDTAEEEAPKKRTRKRAAAKAPDETAAETSEPAAAPEPKAAPKRRTRTKASSDTEAAAAESDAKPAPKRRSRAKAAAPDDAPASESADAETPEADATPPAPKRRTRTRAKAPAPEEKSA